MGVRGRLKRQRGGVRRRNHLVALCHSSLSVSLRYTVYMHAKHPSEIAADRQCDPQGADYDKETASVVREEEKAFAAARLRSPSRVLYDRPAVLVRCRV